MDAKDGTYPSQELYVFHKYSLANDFSVQSLKVDCIAGIPDIMPDPDGTLQEAQLEQVEALVADLGARDIILADVHRLFSAGEDPGRHTCPSA